MVDSEPSPLLALAEIVRDLRDLGVRFGIVGGLAVSVRGEVRTTRDVDIAIAVEQRGLEQIVVELRNRGYDIYKIVEHETADRTATVRLFGRDGVLVDLIAASSGIEAEVVDSATDLALEPVGAVPVARAEDLLALKVLSLSARRPQDAIDAQGLLRANPALDLDRVRMLLGRIGERGFDRGQDLAGKLLSVLRDSGR